MEQINNVSSSELRVSKHNPVLLKEVIDFLKPEQRDFFVDGTLDGGGHAAVILEKILPEGKFLGIDWDGEMIRRTRERFSANPNVGARMSKQIFFEQGNYADLPKILQNENFGKADGLLLDLGFSSEQLENSRRGFGFSKSFGQEPLLMTYNDSRPPVREILRSIKEEDLAKIIFDLSGEKFSKRIARAIKERGRIKPLVTSGELAETIRAAVPGNYERGRINPATRTFQALRIYANDELNNLRKVLGDLPKILNLGGRVAVISFHSLEDKIVKENFREMEKSGQVKILTKKPITSSAEEIASNPRSRSAKLRAAQFIGL
ncbi:MAG: 16S rRNA (cytosine(1402)-N(4))-methyltransferase RsmH [Patescibacteria group bacterium]|nr:16S rRNA (cytosine(1402)-N(4))-methyltransferase RsmH [Patescibacteria group bacterium]MDE2015442.1 16S rRNA (cytosine(1402)-N(4))-methyltransferase RsmH [Patescibacteria group bacterium]MDE2226943.1 16S rRNA (cytosine(1402)-N(4))-methyltransferase RsmH [Patescibacteria group bacterium]